MARDWTSHAYGGGGAYVDHRFAARMDTWIYGWMVRPTYRSMDEWMMNGIMMTPIE